jgi:hypothetical protein
MTVQDGITAPVPLPSPRSSWRRPGRELTTAVERVLASWKAASVAGTAGPDLGPAVLAALVADPATIRDVAPAWLRDGARCGTAGLHGGMSGALAGLRLLGAVHPGLATAAGRAARSLAGVAARGRWRTNDVGFDDYDLVSGPTGMLLAHTTGGLGVHPAHVSTLTAHLAALGADTGLDGLRIGAHRDHPLLDWTQGGIVTGLAHGVAGPLAALSTVLISGTVTSGTEDVVRAVDHMSAWLVAQRTVDALGVVSWPQRVPGPRRPLDVEPRQAWCYGSAGVSWALWTAGDALTRAGHAGGPPLCATAVAAVRTLCDGYDPDVHLTDHEFSVCHGAAGLLLVADAFALHAALPEAARLRDRLACFLHDRLADVLRLADTDPSLLTGAAGVLAALLTVEGADRTWLRCLALA